MWKTLKPVLAGLLSSKKFYMLLAGVIVWLLGKGGLAVTDADVTPVLYLIGTWLGAQGIADIGKESKKLDVAGAKELVAAQAAQASPPKT